MKTTASWRTYSTLFVIAVLSTACPAANSADSESSKQAPPGNYFISSSSGCDDNNGLNAASAWKTFKNVNSRTFTPGDKICLKRNDTWNEKLTLRGSGAPNNNIILDSYGDGNKPVLKMNNDSQDTCVYAKNITNWTIRGLELRKALRGLHIEIADFNSHDLEISSCDFYDMNYSTTDGKTVGIGLCIEADGRDRVFNPKINNCRFFRCVNGLAINAGTQNLTCRDCFATGGLSAGFALVNVRNSLVSRFVVTDVGGYLPYGTCAGFVVWCDGVTIDSCEFARCANGGGHDGVGFDFEGNSKNMIFTNNIMHDNAGAGIMVMSTSGHNSNILIKDCLLYNNCTSASSDKASFEMLCWNNGSTGKIENCRILKSKALGHIHPDFCNFLQKDLHLGNLNSSNQSTIESAQKH